MKIKENNFDYILAAGTQEFEAATELFIEYSRTLEFSLCFQNFEKELSEINLMYNYPEGGIILVKEHGSGEYIGCAGVRRFDNGVAELKRMYLKESFRKLGIGEKLLDRAIELAVRLGYKRLCLDTMKSMTAAIHLYRKKGFKEVDPYRFNPDEEALFFELEL